MDESNDKCDWKKVFKKFLEPKKPEENENIQRNSIDESFFVGGSVDQEKSISKLSLVCSSPASNDSGYSGCKFDFYSKLPSETHGSFDPNLKISEASNHKLGFDNESFFIPPPNYEPNFNVSKDNDYKTEFYKDLSSKKLPTYEFKMNVTQDIGCKPVLNSKLSSKMLSYDVYGNIPCTTDVPEKKVDNFHDGKVPEWNKAFRNILRGNTSDEIVLHQKDICPSKKTGNCKNSDMPGMTSQRKQFNYKPKRRDDKAEKYKDKDFQKTGNCKNSDTPGMTSQRKQFNYKPKRRDDKAEKYKDKDFQVHEAEEKVREIFALSRMFKYEQTNINDFHGCGVDIFKQDQSSPSKSTYGSSKLTDKPYLPLTGFVAKSNPYTAADVAASYVPFEEDAWDDDLLI